MLESRQISWPAYLVSAALLVIPPVDALTTLYPWNVGDARWRFGAIGLLSNAMLLPIAGLLVAYATATVLGQRRLRRVIGVVGYAGAALLLVAVALFTLDAVQTRSSVRPEMRLSFLVASITAGVKTVLAAATLLAFGVAAFRGDRRPTHKRPGSEDLLISSQARAQAP